MQSGKLVVLGEWVSGNPHSCIDWSSFPALLRTEYPFSFVAAAKASGLPKSARKGFGVLQIHTQQTSVARCQVFQRMGTCLPGHMFRLAQLNFPQGAQLYFGNEACKMRLPDDSSDGSCSASLPKWTFQCSSYLTGLTCRFSPHLTHFRLTFLPCFIMWALMEAESWTVESQQSCFCVPGQRKDSWGGG